MLLKNVPQILSGNISEIDIAIENKSVDLYMT